MDMSFWAMMSAIASLIASFCSLRQVILTRKQYNEERQPKLFPTGLNFRQEELKEGIESDKNELPQIGFINMGVYPAINIVAEWDVPYLGNLCDYTERQNCENGIRKSSRINEVNYKKYKAENTDIRQEKVRCWSIGKKAEDSVSIVVPRAILLLLYICYIEKIPFPEAELALRYQNPSLKKFTYIYTIKWLANQDRKRSSTIYKAEFILSERTK
ncbi:hypothetical protein RBH88_03340 [Aminobacterium sp. MB27-C1]|uniref:hypothetical protein n=1 Tax=Aminobacterium sp. MB27-C1 TaxID=3070661 RepID=UPI0027DB97AD|nr:hypothetical protein [Aminobacterium sp. MB27-C1]WMI72148.1 hypothetical protein RBH88_03340 [Aminobacterium sp. MB27-C1]